MPGESYRRRLWSITVVLFEFDVFRAIINFLVNLSNGRQLAECCFTSTETEGLLGTGAQDGHLDFQCFTQFLSSAMEGSS